MTIVSTSFFPLVEPADVDALMASLLALGVEGVELDYRIPAAVLPPVKTALRRAGLVVSSLHNFCPVPSQFAGSGGGGDLLSLAATDRDERNTAVNLTLTTIEQANDLETRAVVLHGGRVDFNAETDLLYAFFQHGRMDTDEARGFVARKLAERDRWKPAHLDALCFSLEKLLPAAERHHVRLGLENRYHYHELPGVDDFELFFREFEGAPLGYWHDTGHAHAGEVLALCAAETLLKRNGSHLVGCHLHDATGLDDHLPPGTGQIDFAALSKWLPPHAPRVIELKPGTPTDAVREGIRGLSAVELT
jgi:sugar phosphate isomerase/epimerase